MNKNLLILCTGCMLFSFFCGPIAAQQPQTFQQHISRKFNQLKSSVADKFRPGSLSYRATDYQADRSLRQRPVVPRNSQSMAQPSSRAPVQTANRQAFNHPQNRLRNQASNNAPVAQAVGYLQEPQPDFQTYEHDPRFQDSFDQPRPVPNQNLIQSPQNPFREGYQEHPQGHFDSAAAYQQHLQSNAQLNSKPQSMDYYNQTQFRHFSNRISATERAIILEDELKRIKDEKVQLLSKIEFLESQIGDRNQQVSKLQEAVDQALEQLSRASKIQQQMQSKINRIEMLRKSEQEASEKLLDELRKQLNDLLASELIGEG